MPGLIMNAKQLAAALGISYSGLRAILKKDESKLPPYMLIGSSKRWYSPTVKMWIEKQTASDSLSGKKHGETSEV